jgi:hypothetical protein
MIDNGVVFVIYCCSFTCFVVDMLAWCAMHKEVLEKGSGTDK